MDSNRTDDRADLSRTEVAAMILADRWRLQILREVVGRKVTRYTDLLALGISTNALADKLKLLVESDLLERRLYREGQARSRYEYHPTKSARGLVLVFAAIDQWG